MNDNIAMDAESLSLDSVVELPNDSEQFDQAAYAAASIFNAVALPKGMPDYLKFAIEAQAERERVQPGPMTATNDTTESKEDREKKATERAAEQAGLIVQAQQREREEWAQAQHSFGTTTMTGTEWRQLADELGSDSAGHRWLMEYLLRQGKTEEEAEQTARDMKLAADGLSKPERDRTADERAAMQRIEANPESAQIIRDYKDAQEQGFPPAAERASKLTNTKQAASTNAGADALDAPFAGAPDLSEHHRAALSAATPLDAPQIAAAALPAPQPTASAGLDR